MISRSRVISVTASSRAVASRMRSTGSRVGEPGRNEAAIRKSGLGLPIFQFSIERGIFSLFKTQNDECHFLCSEIFELENAATPLFRTCWILGRVARPANISTNAVGLGPRFSFPNARK
jgi:hypothetical protein